MTDVVKGPKIQPTEDGLEVKIWVMEPTNDQTTKLSDALTNYGDTGRCDYVPNSVGVVTIGYTTLRQDADKERRNVMRAIVEAGIPDTKIL